MHGGLRRDPGEPLVVDGTLRVVTESSVWLVTAERYCRLPRTEAPRRVQRSEDGALYDGPWRDHVGVWTVTEGDERWLRILPAGRPQGSYGIVTGTIVG